MTIRKSESWESSGDAECNQRDRRTEECFPDEEYSQASVPWALQANPRMGRSKKQQYIRIPVPC